MMPRHTPARERGNVLSLIDLIYAENLFIIVSFRKEYFYCHRKSVNQCEDEAPAADIISELFLRRPAFRAVETRNPVTERVIPVPPFRDTRIPVAFAKDARGNYTP